MCLTSCKTARVVYRVPDLAWPTFPRLPSYELNDDGSVTCDGEYFRDLLVFKTVYGDMVARYTEIKDGTQ